MTDERKSPTTELLPEELLWAEGGHASDVVLTAIADGQVDIVPAAARAHVERCRTCMSHLGHAALLSIHVGRELESVKTAERQPLPRLAIALGLVVAALGLVPSVLEPAELAGARAFAVHDLPLLAQGLGTLAHRLASSDGNVSLVITYATAVLLVAMGFAVVRLLPKKEVSR